MKTYDDLAAELIATHGADTALCDIADRHFAFGSDFDALLKLVGYTQTPKHDISEMNGWGLTVAELIDRERPAREDSPDAGLTVTAFDGGVSIEHNGRGADFRTDGTADGWVDGDGLFNRCAATGDFHSHVRSDIVRQAKALAEQRLGVSFRGAVLPCGEDAE